MYGFRPLVLAATLGVPLAAHAAGDFPLASCKGWNGTVVDLSDRDTAKAGMDGIVTKMDLREYCERDPGGETVQYGGKLTVPQCVERHWKDERRTKLSATANCRTGALSMTMGERVARARFPLDPDSDTSCASGMPPLIEQFKALCPRAAARLGIE